MIWDFVQNEILGMQWLNRLTGSLLSLTGLDLESRIGKSIRFFVYDSIKILILLGVLILLISYIQSYFPPERTKKRSRMGGLKYASCLKSLSSFTKLI